MEKITQIWGKSEMLFIGRFGSAERLGVAQEGLRDPQHGNSLGNSGVAVVHWWFQAR
jgi:hypothetical protein